jgi:two-component system sensor histidine kinase KdpD
LPSNKEGLPRQPFFVSAYTAQNAKIEAMINLQPFNTQKFKAVWAKILKVPPLLFSLRILASLITIVVMTSLLLLYEGDLAVQYVALLFLLPVMISTAFFGMSAGIFSAFASFLSFNYFFIEPYNTLLVHQSQDLITLTIFLIVAIVMSQLLGSSRRSLQLARLREWEATRMYQFIAALAEQTDTHSVARVLSQQCRETFHFVQIEVNLAPWMDIAQYCYRVPDPFNDESLPTLNLMLATPRRVEGELHLWANSTLLSEEEKRLLQAYCNQTAQAVERIHLLQSANKARLLEESDRIKTSLLNSVSHELRSPLAAIKASVSSLRIGAVDWDSAARQELLTTIEEETDALNLLVGNLLDMSRIEAGALQPQLKWNSIEEIVSSAAAKMRSHLQNHKLEFEFSEGLSLVPSDFVLLEQVFTNLISNGVKYAPEGTTIQISAQEEDTVMHVRVKNHSPAVPEEHLEHIFDKFNRITQADKVTGTGLGLSICKGIIEAHGGKIWAENQLDGFCFHFILPKTLNGSLPEKPKDI